jgi:integrase
MAKSATSRKPDPIDTPHLFKRGRQFHYRRRVPKWLQPLVGVTFWWQRLGAEDASARREAAALSRKYDRLCTPAMQRLVRQEGGAAKVRDHLDAMILVGPSPDPPEELLRDLHPKVPGGVFFAINLHNLLAENAKADRELNARLTPLVTALDTDPDPASMTVAEAAAAWLTDIKPASAPRYAMVLRRFRELIGDPPLLAVDRAAVWSFRDQIAAMPSLPRLPAAIRRKTVPGQLAWMKENPRHPPILPGAVHNHLSVLRALFAWCIKRGHTTSNPFDNVDAPADPRGRDAHHHPAMPYADLPAFMAELEQHDRPASKALRLAILTAARTEEVLGACWSEIDLGKKVWTIPAARMKSKREHMVPLSTAAVELLSGLKRDSDRVFNRMPRDALRDFLSRHMHRRGVTVHGFRSTFRDWVAEETTHDTNAAELALAHSVGTKIEAAYRRGSMFEKRRAMMEDWASFCLTRVTE